MRIKSAEEIVLNGIAYIEINPGSCPLCTKPNAKITVSVSQYIRLMAGNEHIQNIIPNVSSDDRETLVSGTCPKCWDELFKIDDDDYDENGFDVENY